MTRLQKLIGIPLAGALMLGGGAIAGYASLAGAQTTTNSAGQRPERPAVMGEITAINGSTITLKAFDRHASSTTTYTVNASGASVMKDGAASSLSNLAVGDRIGVAGTVSGTSVTATSIMSGKGPGGPGFGPGRGGMMGKGVMGTVSAVSGNIITVTGSNGSTYTVDASNAKVSKMVDLEVSDIKVGDTVGVEGSVSGSSVSAAHIMDGISPAPTR